MKGWGSLHFTGRDGRRILEVLGADFLTYD